jgi:hypothetical protein
MAWGPDLLFDSDSDGNGPTLTQQMPPRSPNRAGRAPLGSLPARAHPKGKASALTVPAAYKTVASEHYPDRKSAVAAWQAAGTADRKQLVVVGKSGGNSVRIICREAHLTPKQARAAANKENVQNVPAALDVEDNVRACAFAIKITKHVKREEGAFWAFSADKDTCFEHVNCNGCPRPKTAELTRQSTMRYVYLCCVAPTQACK